MYKIKKEDLWSGPCLQRLSDNAFIPLNEANRDYQEYLKWVAEGNEAEEWVVE